MLLMYKSQLNKCNLQHIVPCIPRLLHCVEGATEVMLGSSTFGWYHSPPKMGTTPPWPLQDRSAAKMYITPPEYMKVG
jgi:hypothetical protein